MNSLKEQWNDIDKKFVNEIIKARKRGLNKAVSKIRNTTVRNIRSKFPNASKPSKYFNDRMIEGARVVKYHESTLIGDGIAGAHVLGTQKKGSGTFRLRFFEGGTKERFVKTHKRKNRKNAGTHTVKGHSVGKIKGLKFFDGAVSSELKNAKSIIDNELKKAIEKCNNG